MPPLTAPHHLPPLPAPMRDALALAHRSLRLSNPNPRVGCVLVDAKGAVIGQGHTQAAGGPHAEIVALADAAARGRSTAGATVYVTLEPCCHHGRTGPCCDALVAAGVKRVVSAIDDPNPRVAGAGFERLHLRQRLAAMHATRGIGRKAQALAVRALR